MTAFAYYNENNPEAAAWLKGLIDAGLVAPGVVDDRSIVEVEPHDLREFRQCHFFAGIGGWSRALRLAGIADDAPFWTASLPCQPFSSAGRQRGTDDDRHLWPVFRRLVAECRPAICAGEQVASGLGRTWLASVRTDLEALEYGVGAADLCAAGAGAPHIRQRLFWAATRLADADCRERGGVAVIRGVEPHREDAGWAEGSGGAPAPGAAGGLVYPEGGGRSRESLRAGPCRQEIRDAERGHLGGLADAQGVGLCGGVAGEGCQNEPRRRAAEDCGPSGVGGPNPANGFWRDADRLWCRDARWRQVEPGTFPLVDGVSAGVVRGGNHGGTINPQATSEARSMRLRGYGNAIVPPLAAAFLRAFKHATAAAQAVQATQDRTPSGGNHVRP